MVMYTSILDPEGFTDLKDIQVLDVHTMLCGIEQTMIRKGPGGGCSPGISRVILWHGADDDP